jgi:hypothetical protein
MRKYLKYILNLDFLSKPLIIRLYLVLILIYMIKRLQTEITDGLIIGLFAYVSGLIGFNIWGKKIKGGENVHKRYEK